MALQSLFGDEFEIKIKETPIKDIIKKIKGQNTEKEVSTEKLLKSKKISLQERLSVINKNVNKILGKQKDNVLVIRDISTFHRYISRAVESGRIAIDTETNNSLDPL